MNSILFALALIATLFCSSQSAPANKGDRLRLKIIKHQPCTGKPTTGERIRFPNLDHAPLLNDAQRGDGCYSINGPVTVRKSISGTVQIYSDIRFGTKSAPETCRKADSSGCGGYGSCVYCDACSNAKNIDQTSSGLVQLDSTDGKSLDCQKGIDAGNYTNIRINFCLPTKDDVLKSEAIDDAFWDQYASGGHMFFVTMYLFDEKVNSLSANQLQKMATTDNEHVIGCHKIIGSIYEADSA
jgi:hypothetical protein